MIGRSVVDKPRTMTAAQRIEVLSSRDPVRLSKYYHEAMREATAIVKESEAQRKASGKD